MLGALHPKLTIIYLLETGNECRKIWIVCGQKTAISASVVWRLRLAMSLILRPAGVSRRLWVGSSRLRFQHMSNCQLWYS